MLRSHTCGELRKKDAGSKVELCGWVDTVRGHGKVSFVDLRDRYGKIQIVLRDGLGEGLKLESCVKISGEVVARGEKMRNKDLETGDVEVVAKGVEVLGESKVLPFELDQDVNEEVRLPQRFLDLRRKEMQENILLRHKVIAAIREYFNGEGFVDVETPILGKSTPEGARDFVVPSRVHAGKFYALPQSPQLFKQLLMMSGFDRYYQIARCFRDEDSRADRQPEFTQLDVEMSFVEPDDILSTMEGVWKHVFDKVLGVKLKTPFPRMTYDEAMKKYGKDNPDTRKKGERFSFVWIVDFPAFEYSKENKRWTSMHHPFTMPTGSFDDPGKMKSQAYDLVLNGSEIGGGSIRIHRSDIQEQVFDVLGIGKKEAQEKFGFLLEALSYGAPPHGGIAFGIDRVVQLMAGADSIREVIAFPKNKAGVDMMLDAPSGLSKGQLDEAHISLKGGGKGSGKKGKK